MLVFEAVGVLKSFTKDEAIGQNCSHKNQPCAVFTVLCEGFCVKVHVGACLNFLTFWINLEHSANEAHQKHWRPIYSEKWEPIHSNMSEGVGRKAGVFNVVSVGKA